MTTNWLIIAAFTVPSLVAGGFLVWRIRPKPYDPIWYWACVAFLSLAIMYFAVVGAIVITPTLALIGMFYLIGAGWKRLAVRRCAQ
jgi:hypothetical protein